MLVMIDAFIPREQYGRGAALSTIKNRRVMARNRLNSPSAQHRVQVSSWIQPITVSAKFFSASVSALSAIRATATRPGQ
jgi:hypothetical protein